MASSQAAYVSTTEVTTSSTYTDLTTKTDTVTVTVGASGSVLVFIYSGIAASAADTIGYASYALSGANTRSADDGLSVAYTTYYYGLNWFGSHFLETGLNAGSTTFKMKYRAGSSTQSFNDRRICVVPLENITAATAAQAYVATAETTSSTSFADLTTTTDTVTVTIGNSGKALVLLNSRITNSNAGPLNYVSYALSGATVRAAGDTTALMQKNWNYGQVIFGGMILETGLATGSTTFKMKYRTSANTGAFQYRRIAVIPL